MKTRPNEMERVIYIYNTTNIIYILARCDIRVKILMRYLQLIMLDAVTWYICAARIVNDTL